MQFANIQQTKNWPSLNVIANSDCRLARWITSSESPIVAWQISCSPCRSCPYHTSSPHLAPLWNTRPIASLNSLNKGKSSVFHSGANHHISAICILPEIVYYHSLQNTNHNSSLDPEDESSHPGTACGGQHPWLWDGWYLQTSWCWTRNVTGDCKCLQTTDKPMKYNMWYHFVAVSNYQTIQLYMKLIEMHIH